MKKHTPLLRPSRKTGQAAGRRSRHKRVHGHLVSLFAVASVLLVILNVAVILTPPARVSATAWDISTATYTQNIPIVGGSIVTSLYFKPDGTAFYYLDDATTDVVRRYNLSSPWDITTAVSNATTSVSTEEATVRGISFSADGTKMYVVGQTGDDVNQYSLSSAWDITTKSFVQTLATGDTAPNGMFFSPNGLHLYITANTANTIRHFTLSSAWDISTATFTDSLNVATQEGNPTAIWMNPDGGTLFMTGVDADSVHEYDLPTPWSFASAAYVQSFSIAAQDGDARGLVFTTDGITMYVLGRSSNRLYEYTMPSGSSGANVGGWSWSDTGGWLSMNSDNAGAGGGTYGVNLDVGTDVVNGFAWSDNQGWVCYGSSCTISSCANGATTPAGTAPTASVDGSNRLRGWAMFCNLGAPSGWISLNCLDTGGAGSCASGSYGPIVNFGTGQFSGYGWHGIEE